MSEDHTRRRDELALVSSEAAIQALASVAGVALGPEGAIAAAFLTPFAVHAARRFREFSARVHENGLDDEEIAEKLAADERLAQMVADAVRGAVESDLAAKRRLLAAAVVRALGDDATVDAEAMLVRTALAVDTIDVRVLALLDEVAGETGERLVESEAVARKRPGLAGAHRPSVAILTAAGLVAGASGWGDPAGVAVTEYGQAFLEALRREGLDEELDQS